MKIILLSDVYNHGVAGEVVDVADGFARNYLIPKGMATQATQGALRKHANIRERSEARRAEYEGMLNDLGHQIDGTDLIFFRRAANTGKLFGSVTTQDIAESLDAATGVDINRRRVSQQPLRDVGLYQVPVRLGSDVSPVLNVRIIAEDERVEYEKQRAAVEDGLIDEIRFDDDGRVVPVDLEQIRSRIERQEAEEQAAADLAAAEEVVTDDDVPAAGQIDDDVPAAAEPVEDTVPGDETE